MLVPALPLSPYGAFNQLPNELIELVMDKAPNLGNASSSLNKLRESAFKSLLQALDPQRKSSRLHNAPSKATSSFLKKWTKALSLVRFNHSEAAIACPQAQKIKKIAYELRDWVRDLPGGETELARTGVLGLWEQLTTLREWAIHRENALYYQFCKCFPHSLGLPELPDNPSEHFTAQLKDALRALPLPSSGQLHFTDLDIEFFPTELCRPDVGILDLGNCRLTTLPDEFKKLRGLMLLDLAGNNIKEPILLDVITLPALCVLTLSKNLPRATKRVLREKARQVNPKLQMQFR